MSTLNLPFPLGATFYGDRTIDVSGSYANVSGVHLEGQMHEFDAVNYNTAGGAVAPFLTGQKTLAMIVRNVSGGFLFPGRALIWSSVGKRVNAHAGGQIAPTGAAIVAGFSDHNLPALGVRDGDLFWLIVRGYCLAKTDTANSAVDYATGAHLVAATQTTAGRTGASTVGQAATFGGRMTAINQSWSASAAAATDGTISQQIMGLAARAVSSLGTATTNADLLVYVKTFFAG